MAVKKATTTEDLTDTAEAGTPTRADLVEGVTDATDPAMVAEVDAPKTVKLKSPWGSVTEVPAGIVDDLLDSGYRKTK